MARLLFGSGNKEMVAPRSGGRYFISTVVVIYISRYIQVWRLSHVAVRISGVYTPTNRTWNLNAYMTLLRETHENMKGLTDHSLIIYFFMSLMCDGSWI